MAENTEPFRTLPFEVKRDFILDLTQKYNWQNFADAELFGEDEEAKKEYLESFYNGHMQFAYPAVLIEINKEDGWVRYRADIDRSAWEEEGFDIRRLYNKLLNKKWFSFALNKEGEIYFSDAIRGVTADNFEYAMRDIIRFIDTTMHEMMDFIEVYKESLKED